MDTSELDLSYQVAADIYYQIVHTLRAALPPPVSDDPADLVRRDNAMMGRIAAMLPGNADEVAVAAQCVAADAEALDCLRRERACGRNAELALQLSMQATAMMRQARSARSLLLRLQAARQKREADLKSLDKANMLEHCALGLMATALGRPPLPPLEQPPPPPPEPDLADEEDAEADLLTEADRYAAIYPDRAALIRSLGGLPPKCSFGPPSPELVHAIVTGDSPILRALVPPVATPA